MTQKTVTLPNPAGLHARPAARFVECASGFACDIRVRKEPTGEEASAKSIVRLLTLGLSQGCTITLKADGAGEQQAVDALAKLVAGFTE